MARKTVTKEEPERKVSGSEVARFFDVDTASVRRWRRDGCPALYYNTKLVRYELSKVEAWLRERGLRRLVVIPPHERKAEEERKALEAKKRASESQPANVANDRS